MAVAAEESAKSKAAKEVIKSLTAQVECFLKVYFHVPLLIYVCSL